MGLGGMKYAWQRQTKDFAHTKGDQYSSLVTDNRGIGDSSKPTKRYSTSEMAADIVEVIDHIGWTGKRELHIIGISMGGMIAQELVSPVNLSRRSLRSDSDAVPSAPANAAFLKHDAKDMSRHDVWSPAVGPAIPMAPNFCSAPPFPHLPRLHAVSELRP
jgi:predicted alpha/beta-fold hydrolase